MTRRPPPGFTVGFHTRGNARGGADRSAEDSRPEKMSDEERAAVRRGLEDVRAGRLATDAEVEAAYRRLRS